MSGVTMLDGNDGNRRGAECHGLPASLLAYIEQKTEAVWKSIDDLQKAMQAVPPAQRSGREWGGDGVTELVKRFGDIRHQHRNCFLKRDK